MIGCSGNLRNFGGISLKRSVFKWWRKETMLFDDFKCSRSELQSRDNNWKTRMPAYVLTLGTDNKWKPDEWSPLGLGAWESMANRYESSPEEKV